MIAVIDTRLGNTNSVLFALDRIGLKYRLTASADEISEASQVILPGVGHAAAGMKKLGDLHLTEVIKRLTQPVFGICLGMQLLFDHSEEGQVDCLGLIPGRVKALRPDGDLPVPHMGWNQIQWVQGDKAKVARDDYFYFVHSYAVDKSAHTVASVTYGSEFAAIVKRDNFVGIQFHPEKSGSQGEELLKFYLES